LAILALAGQEFPFRRGLSAAGWRPRGGVYPPMRRRLADRWAIFVVISGYEPLQSEFLCR